MVSATQIRDGLLEYAHARVLPKFSPARQFAAGTVLGIAAARMDAIIKELSNNGAVRAMGIITENGMVDIDALYEAAVAQLRRQKTLLVDIPMFGQLNFDEADIAELYRTIAAK